jgi:uncharacterized protein YbjT (DUF2867 family)
MTRTLAVTGGTGFVGRILIAIAVAYGWQVRALARRPQPDQEGVVWVAGALDRPEALAELVAGADAVIHLAGVVNAATRDDFTVANVDGTRATLNAATAAGVKRFIHVSSLSAREPQLSNYGQSKAASEDIVAASALDWTVVRPPWVYGPGDSDSLDLFKAAQRGVVPLPPPGRISVIHVSDLARLLLALIDDVGSFGTVYEPDDGRDDWTHRAFAHAIGAAFNRQVKTVSLPKPLLMLAARADRLIRGERAKLTADRVRYFCHPDWRVDATKRPPAALWQPLVDTNLGVKTTLAAYREAKWIV